MANPTKRKKVLILAAIAIVLVALTLMAVFKKRAPVITVQTGNGLAPQPHQRRRGQWQNPARRYQVTISPEVSGEIIELPVKEGQQVKKDALLVKINPDIYIAAVSQAKANYESSLAAKASAVANLEKADADFTRNQELFNRKLLLS